MTDATASNVTAECKEDDNKNNTVKVEKQNNDLPNCLCNTLNNVTLNKLMKENTSKLDTKDTTDSAKENIEIEKCRKSNNHTIENCNEEQNKIEQNKNDIVLQYVYNKKNKQSLGNKTRGHSKNSIERRKRSIEEALISNDQSIVPATVGYSTSHDVKENEDVGLPLLSENVVQDRNLANFHIETVHEIPATQDFKNDHKPVSDIHNLKNLNVIKNEHTKHDSQELVQNDDKEEDTSTTAEVQSKETNRNNDRNYSRDPKPFYAKRNENNEYVDKSLTNQNDNESEEIENDTKNDKIRETYNNSDENSREENKSTENSSESIENTHINKLNDNYNNEPVDTTTAKSFQEVDLDDFSHEKIYINDKGYIEPIKDLHENDYTDELIQSTTTGPEISSVKNNKEYAPLTVDTDSPSGDDLNEPVIPPVNINDGEVKPVVELNNEDDDNSESSEERSSTPQSEHIEKSEENDSSSSEEEINKKGINEKLIDLKRNNGEKIDVKQQFERIPLDYNHDNKSLKEIPDEGNIENTTASPDETINDGTLDALTPRVHKYDDNFNVKFDNIAIKLPEINLPDDILSYSRIGLPKIVKNKKKGSYYFDDKDEESEEKQKEPKKSVADVNKNDDYFGIYNNDKDKYHASYKKDYNHQDDEDDDDGEDLYEKFVRERFGKKGTFNKRSEKLQERKPSNPELLRTIQNILKKTENIQNEAEKSGDPNAGYMWTLEYGENL